MATCSTRPRKNVSFLFNTILDRTVYRDLERERRAVDIQSMMRDVERKDIENARAVLELLRDFNLPIGLEDASKLFQSVHTFTHSTTRLDHHFIGPALGGAAAPVEDEPKKLE